MRLLLIDDDRGIGHALQTTLSTDYDVDVAHTGHGGIQLADDNDYTCILLDLNLPDVSGLRVCEILRNRGCTVPILILSAENQVLHKIKLLDAGADDYLTKPFSLGELKARLRVIERRNRQPVNGGQRLTVSGVTIDGSSHTVRRDGQLIPLRRKEFAILECLIQNSGKIVSRASLGQYAWEQAESPWGNTIDVHMKLLRDKFDKPFNKRLIQTVHGLGYIFDSAGKR
ncbi:MAG: two-component system response regulator [Candidatus Saccharibacteria bacterium]|nr:two-component system response regulator [Candidatus Saccharibacteria bacterium]